MPLYGFSGGCLTAVPCVFAHIHANLFITAQESEYPSAKDETLSVARVFCFRWIWRFPRIGVHVWGVPARRTMLYYTGGR